MQEEQKLIESNERQTEAGKIYKKKVKEKKGGR